MSLNYLVSLPSDPIKSLARGDKFAAYVTRGGFVCEDEEGDT